MPAAIALTPILSARYRAEHLERIRASAPGARLINVSLEGLADGDLSDVEVLLRGPLPAAIFDRLMARCPELTWVHSATAGVERVLTPAALERQLVITNARGVFSRPIAEYVLMMVLAISRRLPQLLELQGERTWQPLESVEMRDLTIGVVGLGSIGRAVAALAGGFGCRVLAVRRQVTAGVTTGVAPGLGDDEDAPELPVRVDAMVPPERIHEVLAESDFVVLGLPLTPETEDLFDEPMLAHMKPGSWLINVARGRLVDERALLRALRDGPLGGAVLDTFRDEPLPPESPLYMLPNVILTPHTSWSSGRVLDRSIELFCDNLRRYQVGEPLRNVVDPGLGY
ncbi:MAG: D-2-hydroxyacid dehydrogenase [Chloroflexi bacterium]|nr:D-2-hydroxyacid dehydrogenase [Chloroflexota bacterium]